MSESHIYFLSYDNASVCVGGVFSNLSLALELHRIPIPKKSQQSKFLTVSLGDYNVH